MISSWIVHGHGCGDIEAETIRGSLQILDRIRPNTSCQADFVCCIAATF